MTLQEVQQPVQLPPQEQEVPVSDGKMTLFHWQIQKEAKKAEGLTPDQLCMQDSDGDTYVEMDTKTVWVVHKKSEILFQR